MASIKEEIAAIAADHGYTGPKPKSTAGAIDALADTLAGTDVKSGRSIAGAIHALAPYIGGGGGSLGELQPSPMSTGFNAPVVGEAMPQASYISGFDLLMGETTVAYNVSGTEKLPAGINVDNFFCSAVNGAYMVAYSFGESDEVPTVTEVVPFSDYTFNDGTLSFTMPVVPQPDGDNNFRTLFFYLTWE